MLLTEFLIYRNCSKVYFIVSAGCGTADEHTEHSAVADWDAFFHSVHRTFCQNNSRRRMNFPSENSTIISAVAHSTQTYEALPASMIRRAGLIQKLRILRSFSCNVKCDSVVCAADVGRQHSCLLRSFSCIAIFQLSRFTRFPSES